MVANCPNQITQVAPQGATSATVFWTEPTATDNSGGEVTVFVNRSPGQSFIIGSTDIVYTFTDPSGNQEFCRFAVVVTGKLCTKYCVVVS